MSPKPKKDSTGDRNASLTNEDAVSKRLPFEPVQTRKKAVKKTTAKPDETVERKSANATAANSQASAGIPEVVSRRMVRRIALFTGIPTGLGMLTFVVSYWIVSHHWLDLPNVAVLFVSMGFLGLGVLGLTYGALSASWDEDRLGSWHGWGEFTINFSRMRESWRSVQKKTDA
jgi:hypothetical protein